MSDQQPMVFSQGGTGYSYVADKVVEYREPTEEKRDVERGWFSTKVRVFTGKRKALRCL